MGGGTGGRLANFHYKPLAIDSGQGPYFSNRDDRPDLPWQLDIKSKAELITYSPKSWLDTMLSDDNVNVKYNRTGFHEAKQDGEWEICNCVIVPHTEIFYANGIPAEVRTFDAAKNYAALQTAHDQNDMSFNVAIAAYAPKATYLLTDMRHWGRFRNEADASEITAEIARIEKEARLQIPARSLAEATPGFFSNVRDVVSGKGKTVLVKQDREIGQVIAYKL